MDLKQVIDNMSEDVILYYLAKRSSKKNKTEEA